MADLRIDSAAYSSLDIANGLYGVYWVSPSVGVVVGADSNADATYWRTVNGGVSWTQFLIQGGTLQHLSCWFDKNTPGDIGNSVHIAWIDSAGADFSYYVSLDVATGILGSSVQIDTTISAGTTANLNRISITKSRSGNILVAFSTPAEIEFYRSVDSGATWLPKANVFESGSERDWLILLPANTSDTSDICGIFWDRSASEISIKMYDDSVDSWTETIVASSMGANDSYQQMGACVRASDGHILLAAHTTYDTILDDLATWDLTPNSISAPTVVSKANLFTDQGESTQAAFVINQQNDDVYLAYLKGGTWQSLNDIVFHKSTDGMSAWGIEQAYSENVSDDFRLVHGGMSVGDDGGRVQFSFYNHDLRDIFVNLTNDIEITVAPPPTGAIMNQIQGANIGADLFNGAIL